MITKEILRNRDIVIVGQQPWDVQIGSNCKNIAIELSKDNRVLYVNSPLDRITRLKFKQDALVKKRIDVIAHKVDGLTLQTENLWELNTDMLIESINWIKIHSIFNFFNKRNNRLFASSISKAISKLGFKEIILFNDNDIFRSFYLQDLLKPKLSIYYSRDFMLGVDYWKFHGELLEPELIRKSDLVVANSVYLANYCRKYNDNSVYIGQGCDLTLFKTQPDMIIPTELDGIPGPVIGYVGSLNSDRLDINILLHIAVSKPEWNIVLVGPADTNFLNSDLKILKNVHFVDSVPEYRLPGFIQFFDVCLNPQLVNEITIGNYPRKIDEYLAMGKPVVATKTEAMVTFENHVYLAENKEQYLTFIGDALENDSETLHQSRIAFASSHTWTNSVGEMAAAVQHTITNL